MTPTSRRALSAALTLPFVTLSLGAQSRTTTRFTPLDSTTASAALARPIAITVSDLQLRDAIAAIAGQAGLSFTFDPSLAGLDRRVTLSAESMTAAAALLRVLDGTGIEALVSSSSQVVLVPRATRRAPRSLGGRILAPARAPVVGAHVELAGTRFAAVSGEDGSFTLGDVPAGDYRLRVVRMGYRPQTLEHLLISATGETPWVELELEQAAVPLEQVVVTPGYFGILQPSLATPRVLTRQQIETVPQIGEDIYRAINRLPGVAASDFSAKFAVRGGSGDQLYVALDGLPLVEPFHLKDIGGGLSILDTQVLGGAELTTGGASAEFGDQLAGVFTMRSLDPRTDRMRTSVGLSIMNLRASSQGGFADGRGSWLVSGRRGYLDLALRLANASDSLQPRYDDVFGKLQFDLAHGGRIAAHVLHAGDNLKYIDSSEPAIRSQYVSDYGWLTWDARLGSRVREQSVVSFGRLRWTRLGEGVRQGAPFASVTDRRSLETGELRQDWSVDVASRALFKIGVDARHEHASYNYFRWLKESYLDANKQPQTRVDTTVAALAPRGDRLGAYVAQRLRPVDALTLEAGVRYDRAWHTGDADFGPRASLSWQPTSSTTMRAAWGIYSQTQSLFGLQVEDGVTRFAPAERAEQRIVGVEQLLPLGIAGRLEAYDRLLSHQRPRYVNAGSGIDMFPEIAYDRVLLSPTDGRARGVELSLARDGGLRMDWALSYALASVTDSVAGSRVPGALDQRHTMHVDWSYHPVSNQWRLSMAAMWHSGWPYTPDVVRVDTLVNASSQTSYFASWSTGTLYSARVPAYERVDARWTRFFDTRSGRVALFVEVYNLLNSKNYRGYHTVVNITNGTVSYQLEPRDGIPRLPLAGLSWEF